MIADVTHFTVKEGGDWHPWPFRPSVKPSNPELLCKGFTKVSVGGNVVQMIWHGRAGDGVIIGFHALRLSDGAEWDVVNGFRNPTDRRPH